MSDDPQDPPVLSAEYAHAVPTWRAAYSDRTAAMLAAFAQLAYAPFENVRAPDGQPRPEVDGGRQLLAENLRAGGFELKGLVNQDDVQVFLAINPGEFAVLAFRGTANWGDWKIDLNAPLIALPDHKGVRVHRGFWQAFAALSDDIRALIDQLELADLGLYITGHSLGGALAQIASMAFERDTLAACYTYGSPRVATLDFDELVKCPHYRIVDNWDLVPGVPPPAPWGYLHSGDPRLLRGSAPGEALRRDQDLLPRALRYLWSFLVWPSTGRISIVDDHMIWNYRTKLEAIATVRASSEIARAAADFVENR
jgi:triacylglycerol lipase